MPFDHLEHANLTVKDIDQTVGFLKTALPSWRVRGEGSMDWYGKRIRWLHIGTDDCYLALQDGGEGAIVPWASHQLGPKHLGIVVASVDAVVRALESAGYTLDHWGGTHPFRKSAYFVEKGSIQFEFIEYFSEVERERNDYSYTNP